MDMNAKFTIRDVKPALNRDQWKASLQQQCLQRVKNNVIRALISREVLGLVAAGELAGGNACCKICVWHSTKTELCDVLVAKYHRNSGLFLLVCC